MATIELSRGLFALIDDADMDLAASKKWYAKPQRRKTGESWYASSSRGRNGTIYLHRFLTGAETGQVVDHINGNGLDNRRSNLRVGDLSLNAVNRRYANASGFRGVSRNSAHTFRARLQSKNGIVWSPSFRTAEDAARAYDKLAVETFGQAAILNFPESIA